MGILKPFVINQTDIQFILDQINFLPLFDQFGNAIINWDGTGTVYNSKNVAYTNVGSAIQNIAAYGTSYQSVTDLAGLRDVAGFNNNLSLVNADFGAVDQIFTRSAAADYTNYSPIMQAVADYAYAAAKQYYSGYSTGVASVDGTFNVSGSLNTDYAIVAGGSQTATDGTHITIKNVVDYTPRMISLATTTAGVTYDTWTNHQFQSDGTTPNPHFSGHTANEIYYGADGVATVLDWGQLATVADGGLGQVDTQARLAASAGQDDHFIGALNPGVSPSNGFFVLFGQFFDHGLDFIDKASGATIKIALAADDPLYGMLGPDGRPVHEITINRATVQTVDANGPEYVNHTSPYIDQSQTYGSHEQLTNLLREWVPDVTTADTSDFHAGMKLFDGTTLADPWTKPDGTVTHDTLPTLNELRAHVVATGRDALTWEDVGDLRNRDGSGHVTAGTSGSALLLDMNPRFDLAHLHAGTGFVDTNHDGIKDGAELTQVEVVDHAIAALNDDVHATYGYGVDLHFNNTSGVLELTGLPGAGTLSGASALYPWVDFSNFGIKPTHAVVSTAISAAVHAAVGDVLMASVGDHYIAGDGRVNENFGLTSIHHIFHEEHNFQLQNLMDAMHREDIVSGDTTHAKLHEFQIQTAQLNAGGDYVVATGVHVANAGGEVQIFNANGTSAGYAASSNVTVNWDQDKMFNAGKLIVEMEYQHAAVDQYARNVTPNIQEFVGYSSSVNSAVSLEYSQAAFRFGHSTLRETIDTIDPTHGLTGKIMGYALKEAFLSPEKFADVGPAAILLGMSHQQMNEVDEFVTPALNQGLLGQPLDLAAINIARGRDVGIPTLNDFREAVGLSRYTSWNDFGQNMQHPTSLANFIAAYSFDGNLAKAQAILGIVDGTAAAGTLGFSLEQAYGFLNGDVAAGGRGTLAFGNIDTWLGGLAEIHQPGGLLGETFDKVFVNQIESLMDGDRFYYLFRLAGQQFAEEVGNGQLKDIVERNTGLTHLNGNIFGYADQYIDLGAKKEVVAPGAEALTTGNEHKYGDIAGIDNGTIGVYSNGGLGNLNDGHTVTIGGVPYVQDTRLANGAQFQINPVNANFEANSLATGAPGVIEDTRGNYTIGSPSDWTISGGVGGLFAPVGSISSSVGHVGGNVVWLHSGATLLKDTGEVLVAGQTYTLGLNVGDRTDAAWPGGEIRLIATDGTTSHVLSSLLLPTPANGAWSHVTLDSGAIGNAYAGFQLRIEVQQNSAGGSQQILVDDIQLRTGSSILNDGVNLDGTPNSGAESSEVIVGTKGNDLIYAQGGDDTVYGDAGNDTIYGGYGIDRLYGGDGADHLYGGDNPDLMDGGSGDDFLFGESSGSDINGNDQVIGGSGNDFISGGIGIDKLSGGTGDDRIFGDQDTDPFTHGSDGNDYVDGGSGGDILYGDNGDDVLVGGADQDQMFGGNGDDIIRPGDTTGALTIGTDEVLGGDGVTDEGNTPGTLGFDLIDFSDNAVRPGGVTFNLADQQNPAVNVNGIPKQIAAFQTEGLIGSAGDDTLTGDSAGDAALANTALDRGENWLIGGSGNDTLMGAGGNDIIIGGSIRLDALIGKYNSGYTYNNNNAGLTPEQQLIDAYYQGASHRVLHSETIDNSGLLGHTETAMFAKHFTELLRSEMFKDTVLGDGGTDGTADQAIYSGNLANYRLTALDATGNVVANPHANWNQVLAIKIADLRNPNAVDANGALIPTDGTDLVVGVDKLVFADRTISPAAYFDKAPVVDLNYAPGTINVASDSFTGVGNAYGRGTGWGNNNSWSETGDNNSPNGGQITVDTAGVIGNPGLHITGGVGNAFNGASVSRAIDLSAYSAATISFTDRQSGISAGESVRVYLSANPPGQNATPLYTINSGVDGTNQPHEFNVTGPFAAGLRLWFVASAMNSSNDNVYIDNIAITAAGDTSPGINNTVAYAEGANATGLGTAVAITTTPHITDPDVVDTTISSAKVVVREQVTGDELHLGPLTGTGITAAGNGTGANGLTGATQIVLSGAALQSIYETVLKSITFDNTTQDPTAHGATLNRHIDVTVNDGLLDSAVATTTVSITAINNPTVLGADNVITNIAAGTNGAANIAIPDWALLANDTDPDTTLSITSIGGGIDGVATSGNGAGHSGSTTTVRDTTTGGGTFAYTVNGSTTATVTLAAQQIGTTLAGSASGDIMIGTDTVTTINGNGGNDIIFGNGGNDTLTGGTEDDRIVYTVTTTGGQNPSVSSGRDFIDGGTTALDANNRDTGSDTFVLNGSQASETFKIMTRAEALLHGITVLNANTEIVIARQTGSVLNSVFTNLVVLAELDNIEEIQVNTLAVTANNGNGGVDGGTTGGDTVQVLGNFGTSTNATTSLNFSTITINGGADDRVDITGLSSDHRIVFNGATNTNQIIGELRPQDVVNLLGTAPSTPVDATVPQPQDIPTPTDPVGTGGPDATDSEDDGDTPPPVSGGHEHEGGHHHHQHHHDHHEQSGSDNSVDAPADATDPTIPVPLAAGTPLVADDNGGTLLGTIDSETILGAAGDDQAFGNGGDDVISGGAGDDYIDGALGNDVLFGGDNADDIFGGAGNDMIYGDSGADRMFGGEGNDLLTGGAGNDTVVGGVGNDLFVAEANDGNDTYYGDDVSGGTGIDTLDMGGISSDITLDLGTGVGGRGSAVSLLSGNDALWSIENVVTGSGNDIIRASNAINVMDGGAGNDTFRFGSAAAANGDTIVGFEAGDKIDLSEIDANSSVSGDQSFTLVPAATGPTQLVVEHESRADGEYTVVTGFTGNGADPAFHLNIAGTHDLTNADFHL